ncbi:hypothetical protein EZV62_016745 [Acer yangbiense]|uniref:Protein SCAR n=1 Tax=Acer yangbiense TaxID=1000413 RepID=A0A5C7HRJ2_9ROSI|nr:hypothetical protein EZV62_016745 [Acer yangbiense]
MPLTRYQIRNEYSLADPELYRAADRDDPEALLEGVAMAGLVGVLRQLGDLAEFAAEIFHDLHEEVMATSARGHGLMIRVQQLEAEFPSIEKAFLSQTNHSPFFSNTGIEWHPNLRMEQNLITRGDLPRCVMDSYEECRGPPRLFLLDKFDVAGVGACLKRYTDPSIFKVEPASSEIPSVEGQREKKIRKVKKKGSRWRNGETPEIAPTSHAKLHQLFLEERVEKGQSDPARLVKLKKRQLNASPFDTRSRKSYMEKFLDSSPESNVVRDISVNLLPLKLMSDNSSESGLEIYDINTVSPVKKSSQAKESICSSPNAQEEVLKPSMEELYGEVIDRQIVEIPEPIADGETDEVPSVLHKVTLEKEIAVDGEGKTEGSIDGDQSDDMTSEVDSYMDALATMESEMETDNEYRLKTDKGFSNVKHGTDSDRNEEPLEFEANFSDSQSVGNFSTSDEGNPSFKKEKSSVSYSDTHSTLAENTPSDGEGGAKVSPSPGMFVAEIKDTPSDQLPANMEIQGAKSHDLVLPTDMCIDEDNTLDLRESSFNSSSMDPNPTLLPSDPEISSLQNKLDGTPSESMKSGYELSNTSGYELSNAEETETHLVNSTAVVSDMPLQVRDDIHFEVCAESQPVNEIEGGDPNVSSDGLLHVSNNLELAPEKKGSAHSEYKVLQTDFAGENSAENVVDKRIGSPKSVTSTVEEQFHCSTMPDVEVDSGSTSLLDGSEVVKHADSASEVDDTFPVTEVYLENSTEVHLENSTSQTVSFKGQQLSDISDSALEVELDSTEKAALSSEEEAKLEDISRIADSEKVDASTCKVDAVEGGAVSLELPSNVPDVSFVEDHVGLHDAAAENVIATEIMAVSATSVAAPSDDFPPSISADDDINDIVCSLPDIICSTSSDPVNLQESHSGIEDSNQEELDSNEPVSPECARRSEADSQLDVASKDLDSASCKLVSYEDSNLEMVDGVHNSSLANTNQNSLPAGDVAIVPASSESSDLELVSKYPHQSILLEDREDATSSPTGNLPDPDLSLEKWQADQCDVENLRAEETSSKSSNHLSEQVQSPNHSDQGRCFNDASVSCQEDLPSQPSPSEYVPQSTGNEINGTEQATDPRSTTALPNFGLPNGGTQVNLEEIPPLPPLPPMQWRLGKFQHAPLFFQRGVIEHSQESFPSMLPFRDNEKVQISFQAPQRGILQSGNPFLPLTAFEVEESHHSDQVVGNELQPTSSSSLQLPATVNGANSQQNSLAFEETQSLNPLSTLSALPIEKPEYSFIASGGETVQSSSNPFLPGPSVENMASRHDSDASQGKPIHPLNQSASEAYALQHTSQNSEGEQQNTSKTSILPPIKVDEQPQHGLPTSERESPLSSTSFALQHTSQNSEEEHQNPSTTSVLPPRKVDEQPQHGLQSSEFESSGPSNPFALQHITQNSEEEERNPSNTSVLTPRKVDEQPQRGLQTSEIESSWPSNPFALQHTIQNSEEEERNPSNTSVLTPRKVDEQPQHGLQTSEIESSWPSNPFALQHTTQNSEEEQRNPSNTSVLTPRKVDEQLQHGLPTSESESSWSSNPFSLQHTTQNSEEEHKNPSNTSIVPSRKVDEERLYGLPTSERESSWSSNQFAFLPTYEVGKANGSSITKLPRPRNPLFDAAAALDKSKLRKVTERDRPQNAPKVDERDSLLEQIRTKSFNLKPAVVTRPSIQGPTTNLKVAAILQKANAIRQVSLSLSLSLSLCMCATAGSDEDDEDNWSDS